MIFGKWCSRILTVVSCGLLFVSELSLNLCKDKETNMMTAKGLDSNVNAEREQQPIDASLS